MEVALFWEVFNRMSRIDQPFILVNGKKYNRRINWRIEGESIW